MATTIFAWLLCHIVPKVQLFQDGSMYRYEIKLLAFDFFTVRTSLRSTGTK